MEMGRQMLDVLMWYIKMNEKAIYRINSSPPASLLNTVEPPSQEHIPIITQTDLDNGYVMRYFTRQSNHTTGEIYEISKQTFDRFRTNSLFQTLELKWKIVEVRIAAEI